MAKLQEVSVRRLRKCKALKTSSSQVKAPTPTLEQPKKHELEPKGWMKSRAYKYHLKVQLKHPQYKHMRPRLQPIDKLQLLIIIQHVLEGTHCHLKFPNIKPKSNLFASNPTTPLPHKCSCTLG